MDYGRILQKEIAKQVALEERIKREQEHLVKHPNDYQTVISALANNDQLQALKEIVYKAEYMADLQQYM